MNNNLTKISEQPIGFMELNRLIKRGFCSRLFELAKELRLNVYIIKKFPNMFETFRFRKILTRKCKGIGVYTINNDKEAASGIKLMMSCYLWHPTVFHIVLADKTYGSILEGFCDSPVGIMEFELTNKDATFSTIEFVDDNAFFYGDENTMKKISMFYPEIESV